MNEDYTSRRSLVAGRRFIKPAKISIDKALGRFTTGEGKQITGAVVFKTLAHRVKIEWPIFYLTYDPFNSLEFELKTILSSSAAEEVEIDSYKDNDAGPKPVDKPG